LPLSRRWRLRPMNHKAITREDVLDFCKKMLVEDLSLLSLEIMRLAIAKEKAVIKQKKRTRAHA
jgi:hypothetical protein